MIYDRIIKETPLSVVNFETTGLSSGFDRIVEISVIRLEPAKTPVLVYDSLVNPRRKLSGTEIHGITEKDVADAPVFSDIVGDVVDSIADTVLVSNNVYFDVPILKYELSMSGVMADFPYFCSMYMRPLLKLGSSCKLEQATKDHVPVKMYHISAEDAKTTTTLLKFYLDKAEELGVKTFRDMEMGGDYRFFESFQYDPLPRAGSIGLMPSGIRVSRAASAADFEQESERARLASYYDTLKAVLADLIVTDEELDLAKEERIRLGLNKEQIRAMHAKVYAAVIARFIDDEFLDDTEAAKLKKLTDCLRKLGWTPGM